MSQESSPHCWRSTRVLPLRFHWSPARAAHYAEYNPTSLTCRISMRQTVTVILVHAQLLHSNLLTQRNQPLRIRSESPPATDCGRFWGSIWSAVPPSSPSRCEDVDSRLVTPELAFHRPLVRAGVPDDVRGQVPSHLAAVTGGLVIFLRRFFGRTMCGDHDDPSA